MELREAIGRRRSMRFLRPYKMVEPEKIQRMLEAARIASHWGNVQSLRAVAIFRNSASQEVLDSLQAQVVGWQLRIAPVVIVWYIQPEAVDDQSDRLRELVNVGALGFGGLEKRKDALENQLIPFFDNVKERLKNPGIGEVDCGQGIAQATLMAFEQGLGTCCLGTPKGRQILDGLGVPDSARFLLLQTVGYPLEHWEAGGQRPRQDFDKLFHMNGFDTPFPRSPEVVDELEQDGMFTRPGPLPEREEELEFLKQALGLQGAGLL
ncbi:MAG: nitroreductase family protein [Alphaproteobacteria bacterium]|jgi:nitroreductase|nr:nitroreductase family protein [Alphaproteobacteria bacterium]MDP6564730.1 nitroreductase family protein [Alphaproteobacteria bacterium]MDP6812561.1 nitroreductase family protein [Alphaproteobacteria bacterium]